MVTPHEAEPIYDWRQRFGQDLYFSFMFSQGNKGHQRELFKYFALYYSSSEIKQILQEGFIFGLSILDKLSESLPKFHQDRDDTKKEFFEGFKDFIIILELPNRNTDMDLEEERDKSAFNIARMIMKDDFKHIEKGRNRRRSGDIYESIFRSFILTGERKATGNADDLVKRIRRINSSIHDTWKGNDLVRLMNPRSLEESVISDYLNNFNKLSGIWKKKHPSLQFFPASSESQPAQPSRRP